eukprot:5980225-Karenia_brevis.AAC.1
MAWTLSVSGASNFGFLCRDWARPSHLAPVQASGQAHVGVWLPMPQASYFHVEIEYPLSVAKWQMTNSDRDSHYQTQMVVMMMMMAMMRMMMMM